MSKQSRACRTLLPLSLLLSFFLTPDALAECGGQQECIAVSTDPGVAPAHGTPLTSTPLTFGAADVGANTVTQSIYVGAVTGPAGTRATINSITEAGSNPEDFVVDNGTCIVGAPSLLQDSTTCEIKVSFAPTASGGRTAEVRISTSAITRTVPLTGEGVLPAPEAPEITSGKSVSLDAGEFFSDYTVTATRDPDSFGATGLPPGLSVNSSTGLISGTATSPGTFTASVSATNSGGTGRKVVSFVVSGQISPSDRPDPTQDADTRTLQRTQLDTAKRVSRAQISNIQRRLETLHNRHSRTAGTTRAQGSVVTRNPPHADDRSSHDIDAGSALAAGDSFQADTLGTGSPLLTALADLAQSGSMQLDGDYTGSSGALAGASVWVGGSVGFGTRDAAYGSSKLRFTSDGISAGVDKIFGETLVLGLALGYANDQTDVGQVESHSETDFWSLSVYSSYQPLPQIFIDGMLGYGHLDYDVRRAVSFNRDAYSDRDGDQLFGSVAVSYEYHRDRLLLSPYGRVDFAFTWLDSSTETGAGQSSLHYFSQDFDSAQLALGFRAESAHEMSYGWVIPRLRLEYLRQFESDRRQSIAYADQLAGQRFWLLSPDSNENSLLIGIGTDFDLNNGVRLGFDYQTVQASGNDDMQAFGLWLSKSFDQASNPWSLFGPRTFRNPVRVEAGFMWDENLNRAPIDGDKIADKLYNISVQQRFVRPLTNKIRLVATGVLGGTKLHKNDGLDNIMGEARGELQYRTSGHFLAPTFGAYAKIRGEEFSSSMRSGYRYAYGVNARQALSDRLGAFAAVERNVREGDSEVFENRDWAARLHLDYALGPWGFAYVGGEFRHGDVVTSISGGAAYESGVAEVTEADDAYYNENLVAARVDAETWMASAGYNFPLGPRDSLDLSWRWVISTPDRYAAPHSGPADGGGSYITNQISAAYLLRF